MTHFNKFGEIAILDPFPMNRAKSRWLLTFVSAESAAAALNFTDHQSSIRNLCVCAADSTLQLDNPVPRAQVLAAERNATETTANDSLDSDKRDEQIDGATNVSLIDVGEKCLVNIFEYLTDLNDLTDLMAVADTCTSFSVLASRAFAQTFIPIFIMPHTYGGISQEHFQFLTSLGAGLKELVFPTRIHQMKAREFKHLLKITKYLCPNLETLCLKMKKEFLPEINDELKSIRHLKINFWHGPIAALLTKLDENVLESLKLTGGVASKDLVANLKKFPNLRSLHLEYIQKMPSVKDFGNIKMLTKLTFEGITMRFGETDLIELMTTPAQLKQITFINTGFLCTKDVYNKVVAIRRQRCNDVGSLDIRNIKYRHSHHFTSSVEDRKYATYRVAQYKSSLWELSYLYSMPDIDYYHY